MTNRASQDRPWNEVLRPYAECSLSRSIFQVLNSAIPFVLIWLLMYWSLSVSYLLTLGLAVIAAGFKIRLFIIQHDCGHGSFFKSQKANDAVGFCIGVLTLTPYAYWRKTHAIHHATSGNLDRREFGDVTTLTVREYLALGWWKRLVYRMYRNPIVLFVVGPIYQFVLKHRLPFDLPLSWKREWASVMWTNLALAGVLLFMWATIGLEAFLLVHTPIFMLGSAAGVWLFYIQHQFEDTYWEGSENWSYYPSGLQGSSYYDLHPVLRWFTGNIGVHHVHHMSSQIPNYRLYECFQAHPDLQNVTRLTLTESLKCIRLKLWDEENKRLVGFGDLKRLEATAEQASGS